MLFPAKNGARPRPNREILQKEKSRRNIQRKFLNYILSKIESHINKNQGATNYSLHYILPRKPDDAWGEIKNAEELTAYTGRIGNLLLVNTPVNQQIKSLPFHEKATSTPGYNECNSALTRELISHINDWAPENIWNFTSINKRQRYMAEEYSQQVWPL
jgi:hypothetical protein